MTGIQLAIAHGRATKRMICGKCKMIMRRPQISGICGHRFCDGCVVDILATHGKCSTCTPNPDQQCSTSRNPLFGRVMDKNELTLDEGVLHDVHNLPAMCVHDQCFWFGTMLEYIENHETRCRFSGIPMIEDMEHEKTQAPVHVVLTDSTTAENAENIARVTRRCDRLAMDLTRVTKNKIRVIKGEFVWKIINYHGGPIESPEFYTSALGYFMKLRVNTYGAMLGLHSVILPGVNDEVLDWPFKQRLHVTLLCPNDQFNRKTAHDITTIMQPSLTPNTQAHTRPHIGGPENPGHGKENFIQRSVLEAQYFTSKRDFFLHVKPE